MAAGGVGMGCTSLRSVRSQEDWDTSYAWFNSSSRHTRGMTCRKTRPSGENEKDNSRRRRGGGAMAPSLRNKKKIGGLTWNLFYCLAPSYLHIYYLLQLKFLQCGSTSIAVDKLCHFKIKWCLVRWSGNAILIFYITIYFFSHRGRLLACTIYPTSF